MKDFRDLQVWRKSHKLTLSIYEVTQGFPKQEMYGLISQLRRSSASIPTNIAEGCGRRGNGEFHKFLQIATGSASEVEYQLLLSRDLNYITVEDHASLSEAVIEVKRMLSSLINKVERDRLTSTH